MKLFTFHRGDMFYPIELRDDTDARNNALCNDGTTMVKDFAGNVVWEDKGRKYDKEFVKFDDDDYFTVEEWLSDCKDKGFSNYDGSGYWVKQGRMNHDDEVFSTEPEDATHVIWYNK